MTQSDNRTPHPMTEDSTETLMPCPFCGGRKVQTIAYAGEPDEDDPKWWIGCTVCDAGIDHQTKAAAITAWNTRIPTPTTGEAGELVKRFRAFAGQWVKGSLRDDDIYTFSDRTGEHTIRASDLKTAADLIEHLSTRDTEASERIAKLEEEVAKLEVAISWIEPPFVDGSTPAAELRKRVQLCVADAKRVERARQALHTGRGE